ncbi:MAG: ATP-binding cassette domain-containing protein [bacterium]|nr:ATP-binding cassette domain-containing protein [bacterium]
MKIQFENVCFTYNSSSGKTTLLQHFTGLLRPSSGTIYVDHRNIWKKGYSLSELRRKIGLVFQFPESQLFEETVAADVGFGPKALGLDDEEISIRTEEALKLVGMENAIIGERSPHQLSEGEKRRVAIAGVLAMAPDVLILDEPTACLDPAGVKLVLQILKKLHQEGITIIVVTHSIEAIVQLVQRIIIMNHGEIFFDGVKEAPFSNEAILTKVDLEPPRLVRFCKYLQKLEILSTCNSYSTEDLIEQIKKLKNVTAP